jgi:hypothetical protein
LAGDSALETSRRTAPQLQDPVCMPDDIKGGGFSTLGLASKTDPVGV